jgi:pilus assembly protein CpaC
VKINFTPDILEDGTIKLKIDPAEVSSLGPEQTFSTGIFAPIIDTRTVNTNVDLREGDTLIIAGMLDDRVTKVINKLPILADVPILGALFRSTDDELENRELTFIITPRIIRSEPMGDLYKIPAVEHATPQNEPGYEWVPPLSHGSEEKK